MSDERPHDLRGSTVAGARVDRVLHRPHEVRVYLRGADPRQSVWLHFWPATEAKVGVLAPERAATHLTTGPDTRVRLRAGDQIVLEAVAPEWSWHPYDAAADEHLWQLDEPGTLTDLSLQMELTRAADGTVTVLLRDLHML